MPEKETEVVTKVVEVTPSLRHQFGKLMVGGIAGFAANVLAEKGYDYVLKIYRAKKASA